MADTANTPHPSPADVVEDHIETASMRRAPKLSVFLLLGAALGVIVALILTFAFHGTDEASASTGVQYTQLQVFGFVSLICIPAGLALMGMVAVWLDRRAARHAHQVTIDRSHVHSAE